MRHRLLTLVLALLPQAAQAGEAFDIPPAGVLRPQTALASLYSPDLAGSATIASAPPGATAAAPAPRPRKPVARRGPSAYVRHSTRPPASLPPAEASAQAAPPAQTLQSARPAQPPAYSAPAPASGRPAPAAGERGLFGASAPASAPAAPAGLSSIGSYFRDLFGAPRSGAGGRGLFTSAAETPPPAYPVRQMPAQPSQIY
ncbi:MAG TPA: hypothetical protein VHA55_13265 [Pseudorhodoplanes sp.]|jgi:hypothetical protein|nr:hypothetical protein [Pseudorhodoplanes sp.]